MLLPKNQFLVYYGLDKKTKKFCHVGAFSGNKELTEWIKNNFEKDRDFFSYYTKQQATYAADQAFHKIPILNVFRYNGKNSNIGAILPSHYAHNTLLEVPNQSVLTILEKSPLTFQS